jgi:hypothetical protein
MTTLTMWAIGTLLATMTLLPIAIALSELHDWLRHSPAIVLCMVIVLAGIVSYFVVYI